MTSGISDCALFKHRGVADDIGFDVVLIGVNAKPYAVFAICMIRLYEVGILQVML